MSYSVELSPGAAKDLAKLRKSEPKAFEKALPFVPMRNFDYLQDIEPQPKI